jgi:protein CpxP
MSTVPRSRLPSASVTRSIAVAALMSVGMVALTAAHAETATKGPVHLVPAAATQHTQIAAAATATKGESVEQRITSLHAQLKITPTEDSSWNGVAQAMRENAAKMDELVATNRATPAQNRTAVADLQTYEKFAQAHLDGLKNLISSFETLYDAMPGPQKQLADHVFMTSGHELTNGHHATKQS